ncbi:MAG: element excision factor XisH family protein [Isosphaeraceae bacterium]
MPARNINHDAVVHALIEDGWTITHDPLTLSYGGRDLFVDLGAERVTLAAEKTGRKIAVEIQSFASQSPVRDLEEAVGQYEVYRAILAEMEPERQLFLAAPLRIHETFFEEKFGQFILSRLQLAVLVFDETQQRVVKWINSTDTGAS